MDLSNISNLLIPIVVLACLVVGYCIKSVPALEKISNNYIPTILAVLGAVLGCVASQYIGLEPIVYGALSGLASTGLHQAFTKLLAELGGN